MPYPLSQQQQLLNERLDQVKKDIDALIDGVIVKSLFSGYGFFKDEYMFGILQSGIFHLRAEGELAEMLNALGALSSSDSSNYALSKDYYRLPLRVMENAALFKQLIQASIAQLKQQKQRIALKEKTRIKDLINLSFKHERPLAKIGINNVASLQRLGAAKAYALLRQAGILVNLQFFWNLYAALLSIPTLWLSEEQQKEAFEELNRVLEKYGLRAEKFKKPY
ncbi:TfoX/Sxy family DNA transformation protein [Spirabiliibacterium falconis]|uniref:TfoX/Sxy family DNA transformation protein n=1 Tax=Spirabiliibacterium falconis TaxID=572023 RepID=UPI001AAC67C6|nr:TfoX/Sxy family DNA transformation protein [Spirabiliibacterium falconis]MBE2894817.1 TfoX/Sxy family DNA transformation protein [Spirabiliibacterium falconis]